MTFSEKVKFTREKLNYSQEDLGRELLVSFATINRWEREQTVPNKLTKKVFYDFCEKKGIKF